MKIDLERFIALTTMLAAPLVTASGCIITGSDDDANGTDDGASADDGGDPSGNPSSGDDAPMTDATATDDGETGTGTATVTATGTDGGTEGTTGDSVDTTAGQDSTGGNPLGNCCEPHDGMGCEFSDVADCVCAEDPFCCDTMWDLNCVSQVNVLGCGECELPPQVWDCYCTADCDGAIVDTPWQVCTGDELEAAELGTAACEADLGMQCDTFVCDECSCFTAEVPDIDCP